ncbi:MAG TPA: DUF4384 domain-containing protein [Gemmatimonadales bacterium]|nr:DUF4384 domain-containing protein [Gemmatimonadales bacterium]
MITALLLPLVLAADSGARPPAAGQLHDDPPIQLWINNDRRFLPGEEAKVQVRTEEDGYLLVFHVDPEGFLRVLFPIDPDRDNYVRGGKKYEVRGRGDREAFEADGKGRGTVYAAVSRAPFRFENFVVGDHWDYRALAPSRLSSNPEPELNELVRRMAQGDFDYDLLTYDVVERESYASAYYPRYYGSVHDDWCYTFSCGRYYYGSPWRISIYFGRPYRYYYYDPYFYAYHPFYNPFFYDPYYYAPAYYPRYVYSHRYYYPWRDRYYYDRYWDRYTPYRFRGGDGFVDRYRDRRYDLGRSVNTVYHPPISPVREPSVARPARRVIESPSAELPSGVARRRLGDDVRRVQGRPVEARRARPEQAREERSAGEPRLIRREVEARSPQEQRTPREARSPQEPRTPREARSPREERVREAPRPADRAPEAQSRPPRREADRGSSAPPPRASGRAEGRSSGGGGREAGESRPRPDGERRRR